MPTPNNSSHKYTPEEIQLYLSQLQHQSTIAFIPTLVYLSLLIIVGSVGNCLVLAIYSCKMTQTPLRIFIISMAIFDLPTNLLVIPGEIYDMLHVWDFDMPNVCKIRRYLNAAIVISSVFVLFAIAITRFNPFRLTVPLGALACCTQWDSRPERYKMVCSPLEEQVTITQAKLTSGVIVAISCIISLPYGIIHGSQTIKTPKPEIYGHYCGVDDSYVKTIWPNVNSAFFILIFVTCCLSMTVFYACIGHKTWKHCQKRKSLLQVASFSKLKKISVTKSPNLDRKNAFQRFEMTRKISGVGQQIKTEIIDLVKRDNTESTSPLSNIQRKISGHHSGENSLGNFNFTTLGDEVPNSFETEKIKGRRTFFGKTSWLMFIVSLVFVLAFVPFLALNFYKTALPESYAALKGVSLAIYHLFQRSHYINSAINPIVYSLLDRNFKSTCSQLLHG